MCGIGGILRTDGGTIPDAWLDAMDARIRHRGPDGHGRFRDRVTIDASPARKVVEVALVHRRLSIIDPADGAQPMVSPRGRTDGEGLVAVVFNGCIYNHRELRRELERDGRRFVTDHSDTEVLIHGHREWGAGLRERLEGMYAYAIWDHGAASLSLARDRFGEKPLYFRVRGAGGAEPDSTVTFCSARGALADGEDDAGPCGAERLERYLRRGFGWGDGPGAPGRGTRRVFAGGAFRFDAAGGGRALPPPPLPAVSGDGDAIDVEGLLDRAVARRLEADVPLGCFLSGGVDSSLIACFAKRHRPELRTFSVRMPDPRYDESAYAERVAAHLATDHTTLDVAMRPAEDLVRLVESLGQPFADSSILPTYWVSRAAREHVKVALSGDGGDELFVGYERYLAADTLARHWRWLRLLPPGLEHRAHPKSLRHKLGRLGTMARDYRRLGIVAMESIFSRADVADLLGRSPAIDSPDDASHDTSLPASERLRRHDVTCYLPEDLLCKVDTASMAVALEVRAPFLDRDLAAAALSMPVRRLAPGGRRKGLLRTVARRHLPRDAVERPKMGFAVPIGEWFRTDFGGMRTLLLDRLGSRDPFGPLELNRRAVRRFIDEHQGGRRDHGHRLFSLLTLSLWTQTCGTASRTQTPG